MTALDRACARRNVPDQDGEAEWDTIIVGAGMSGLGCARRLYDSGRRFLLVSPEVGGRVRLSPDGLVNYGAYYVTTDYRHTLPLVRLGERVRITDAWFHNDNGRYRWCSTRMVRHLPALLRFTADLRRFRRRFNRMNSLAAHVTRRELIERDPLLREAYRRPGFAYVRSRGLEGLFRDYIDHLLWASFFRDPREVSTFFLLAASLPLIVPMHTFTLDTAAALRGFEDRLLQDTVVHVELSGDRHRLRTAAGRELRCRNVVLATPMHLTNRLLGELAQPIKGGIDVSFYHVRGELHGTYQGAKRNFFSSREAAIISRESDGSYLYFYDTDRIDNYFARHEVVTHDHWRPALYFLGEQFIDSHPAPGVFIASDHDMPSMENAYLNGQYAAGLLLRQEQREPPRAISRSRVVDPSRSRRVRSLSGSRRLSR